jgi:hypothetical protein
MIDYDQPPRRRKSRVGRWLFVSLAVLVAVPVVLWSLVTVVRSYVMPPRVPVYRPAAITAESPHGAAERSSMLSVNAPAVAAVAANSRSVASDAMAASQSPSSNPSKTSDRVPTRAAQSSLWPPVPAPQSAAPATTAAIAPTPQPRPASAGEPANTGRDAFASPIWQDALAREAAPVATVPVRPPATSPNQTQRPPTPNTATAAPPAAPGPQASAVFDQRMPSEAAFSPAPVRESVPVPPRRGSAPAPAVATLARSGGVPMPRPRPAEAPESDGAVVEPPPGKEHNQF